MGSSATAQGIVKKSTNVFITPEDVSLLMNCKKSKAYAIIRNVNEHAQKKGQLKFPVGKANKYLFAEIYGIPIEDVNRIISGEEVAYGAEDSSAVCRNA